MSGTSAIFRRGAYSPTHNRANKCLFYLQKPRIGDLLPEGMRMRMQEVIF